MVISANVMLKEKKKMTVSVESTLNLGRLEGQKVSMAVFK